jgi:carbon storage regulator CsrA
MLVLSFAELESVVIGEDILISVTEVQGRKVRLALQGPMSFIREELLLDSARDARLSGKPGCLILSRKAQQSIVIGDLGTLTVNSIRGGKTRLGFDFPSDVRILRKGVYEANLGSFPYYEEPWKKAA